MYRVLDLFSGIGGFSLGLERTGGFKTVAFCEIDPYCQKVLAKHWPGVPIYSDVRELTAARLQSDGIAPNVITGGFPCQDISVAGRGAGIEGSRSGLWSEYARIISELRPAYVIVENVAALLGRGLERVLGDLASFGYGAEWNCIPASALGAPHRRDRLWLVANPDGAERGAVSEARQRLAWADCLSQWQEGPSGLGAGGEVVADADQQRSQRGLQRCEPSPQAKESASRCGKADDVGNTQGPRLSTCVMGPGEVQLGGAGSGASWWFSEPNVGRVAYGVPSRVDRLRALGNAVVPQIPELIGRAILEAERTA